MKKIILFVLTLAAFFVFLNKHMFAQETRTFNFKDFTEVDAGWGMSVNIQQASSYSVEVKADQRDLEVLKVEQKGSRLKFYIDKNNYRKHGTVNVNIKLPVLTAIDLSGGAKGKISMDISSKKILGDLSGGSSIEGKLSCGDLHLSLSGGSVSKLQGKGKNFEVEGAGGSIFKMKNFSVMDVNADLSGGSSLKITMNGTLNTDQSGGSEIVYYGKADVGKTDFSGGSRISKGD